MILINGCSFTYGVGLENLNDSYSVKYCIDKNLPFNKIAAPGFSNDNIRSTTISELLNHPEQYQLVMINWTTPWRLNLGRLLPKDTPVNVFLTSTFNGNHSDAKQKNIDLAAFWTHFFDAFYFHRCYFESVFLVQQFCKSKNIKCVFTNTTRMIEPSDWKTLSSIVKADSMHPDMYLNHFTGSADELRLSYQRLYRKNDIGLIKEFFKTIICYVDAIDWNCFVGLDQRPLYSFDQLWPQTISAHPGIEAHCYWLDVLKNDARLNQLVKNL